MISSHAECIVFSNGQAAYLVDDYFFYLNDLIYCPKYQEMAVFNVYSQQLKVKLREILQHQEMFMPIDTLQVKHVLVKGENLTVISAVVRNYLFLFQANSVSCDLFFVFEYNKEQKIEHVKMRKESEKLLILVILNGQSDGIVPSLIDISYGKLVLNMTYIGEPIMQPLLTNHMSSLNMDDDLWYLSLGHTLYALDFKKPSSNLIFETESFLSPIVKLNKVKKNAKETTIMAVTLENRVYKIGRDETQQECLQLAVNSLGLHKVSKDQLFPLFIGLGNSNQASLGDSKTTLYFYAPFPENIEMITKRMESNSDSVNVFDL